MGEGHECGRGRPTPKRVGVGILLAIVIMLSVQEAGMPPLVQSSLAPRRRFQNGTRCPSGCRGSPA